MLAHLFENNRTWARRIVESQPDFFRTLSRQQSPRYLWIYSLRHELLRDLGFTATALEDVPATSSAAVAVLAEARHASTG